MIEMMRAPLVTGGSVLILVRCITSAVTNKNNEDWTDVYTDTNSEGFTIDMDVDAFLEVWMAALLGEPEDYEDDDVVDTTAALH